jgi:hypothetical protein
LIVMAGSARELRCFQPDDPPRASCTTMFA